jgi:predicted phosphodiesterase
MKIAVLADIHGNLPALRAVLGDVDAAAPEALVVAGDIVAGPLVRECLDALDRRPEPTYWISGNSERDAVRAYDGAPTADDPPGRAAAWSAAAIDGYWRDQLASWPISLALDGVRFCHGSPRDDDEILTRVTPDPVFASALADVSEPLVVGDHTHRQFLHAVRDGLRYANASSIGLPYEGRRGAYWMLVHGGEPEMRRTDYDFDAALVEMRASGFAALDDHFMESLITPADADGVSAFLEGRAGR